MQQNTKNTRQSRLNKHVRSGGAYLRGVAFEQHSFEETSQRWRTVGLLPGS